MEKVSDHIRTLFLWFVPSETNPTGLQQSPNYASIRPWWRCRDFDFKLWTLNFDLYDWQTLNFEYWTLTFMISPIMKMICRQEVCRDARLVRPLRWECKSIYIGSCVRSRWMTSKQHGCWSECTQRFGRTHEPCVPTCIRATHHIRRIDYQRLTPCVSISAISPCNMADFTA